MSPREVDPPKRHTGELYDAVWELDVPTMPNKPTDKNPNPTGVAVAPSAVRLVLMAMAMHTNPHRDKGQWRCCPTVERLAKLADLSVRQVQRVLAVFVELGYIEIERKGLSAGRGRAAKPTWWCLRPDLWPRRETKANGGVAHVVTIGDSAMVASHAPMATSPASRPINGDDAGDREVAMATTPASPQPGIRLTRNSGIEPGNEPARAAAHAADVSLGDESKNNDRTKGHQVALPLTSAVGLVSPEPALTAPTPVVDAVAEGKRIWESARHQLLRPGAGVDPALIARARNTAAAGYIVADGVLTLDGDLVAEDLEPGSTVAAAVSSAARGRQLELRLVGGDPPSHVPVGQQARVETNSVEQADDEAAIRARLRSKLSAEELALLDELERRRVSYADGPVVPAADDQVDEAQVEQQTPVEVESDAVKTEHVDEAPRRRRKRATAAA